MPKEKDDLEPVTDQKIIDRYLQYTVELAETISCFVESKDLRFDAYARTFQPETSEISLEIADDDFKKMKDAALNDLGKPGIPVRLSFKAGDALFFAGTQTQRRISRTIYVKVENPIFKLQRRNALRIKPMTAHGAHLTVAHNKYDLYDISATGCSILIPLPREASFPKGSIFSQTPIRFSGADFKVDIEVMGFTTVNEALNMTKVGLRFNNLPAGFESLIAKEAYLQTHKIWSRWI